MANRRAEKETFAFPTTRSMIVRYGPAGLGLPSGVSRGTAIDNGVWHINSSGELRADLNPLAGIPAGVVVTAHPAFRIPGRLVPNVAIEGVTNPLNTGHDKLTGWTKNRSKMGNETLADGTARIISSGETWNAVTEPGACKVTAGDIYYATLVFRKTDDAGLYLALAEETRNLASTFCLDPEGVQSETCAFGAMRTVFTGAEGGWQTLVLRWVPNVSGTVTLRVGPNVDVQGTYIDVRRFCITLQARARSVPSLFPNPMDRAQNPNFGLISTWTAWKINARADLAAEADPQQVPQRITAMTADAKVMTPVELRAGNRYTVAAVWRKGTYGNRIRLGIDINGKWQGCTLVAEGKQNLSEAAGKIDRVIYERFGNFRRLVWEFVSTEEGSGTLGVGPNGAALGDYFDLFRVGISESAGALVWQAPVGTGTINTAWPNATNPAIVEQNMVKDALNQFRRDADGAIEHIVSLPKGSINPGNKSTPLGGTSFYDRFRKAYGGDLEGLLSYDIRLGEGFVYGKGGKLPGLMSGRNNSAGSGTVMEGWSTRYMWSPSGLPYLYLYIATRTPLGFGIDVGVSPGALITGTWHTLTQRVKLNEVGVSNGEIEIWFDGMPVALVRDLEIRAVESHRIEGMLQDTFFGGADPSWAHPRNETITFRNYRYWKLR